MRKFILSLSCLLAMTTMGAPVKVGDLWYEVNGTNTVKVVRDPASLNNSNPYKGAYTVPSTVNINGTTYTVNEIGENCFRGSSVNAITLPNTITRIGSFAFGSTSSLKSLVLPSSLRVLENECFSFSGLNKLTIEEGLDSVGFGGLGYMNQMSDTLRLPASLRALAPGALGYSHKMVAFKVADNNPYWKSVDGVVFSKDGKTLFAFPCYKMVEGGYTCPSGVSYIEKFACAYLDRLTSFQFSYTTVDIGEGAFQNCQKIEEFKRATSIRNIGPCGFSSCTHLMNMEFGYNLQHLDSAALSGVGSYATGPVNLNFSSARNLRYIGDYAFGNARMQTLSLQASVDTIFPTAFQNCSNLKRIDIANANKKFASINGCIYDKDITTLLIVPGGHTDEIFNMPRGVKHIGPNAFYRCLNVKDIPLPDDMESFGERSFYGAGLIRMTIPAGVSYLPLECFASSSISKIEIPTTVTGMDGGVFSACANLESAIMPDELDSVAPGTFFNCQKLAKVNIPKNAKKIGYNSFAQCFGLTKVVVPDKVETIETGAFRTANNPMIQGKIDTLILGAKLSKIEADAFLGQNVITYIQCNNSVPAECDSNGVFMTNVHNKALVDVPTGTLNAYKSAKIWRLFKNWREFNPTQSVTTISNDNNDIEYTLEEGAIEFRGEGQVAVYSVTGNCIYTGQARRIEVPQSGIYILYCNGKTAKVMIK